MNQVKYRNMWVQPLLVLVTFGIYCFYWFYQTAQELKIVANDSEASPTLWTLFLFFPFVNIYAFYKYSELYEKVCTEKINKWVLFLFYFVFMPVIWFLVQKDLNRLAETQKA